MKIALVTGPFNPQPPGPAGAVERLTHDLGRCFAAAGHEVTLLGRGHPGLPPREEAPGLHILRKGALRSTGSVRFNLVKDLLHSLRMLRLLPADADLWSTNAFWLPLLADKLRRRQGRGPVLVVNAHRRPKGQYRRLYRGTDHFIAVSTAVAKAIQSEAPWTTGRVSVLLNPIDTRHFNPATPRTEQPGAPLIVFTGRIHPLKGLDLLVCACHRLLPEFPGLRLRLIGPVEVPQGGAGADYAAQLRRLAGSLPLEIPGPVGDRALLAAELRSATAYVYPTIDEQGEALPIAPMEAMAVGTPVVLSALDCFSDYLREGENGLSFDHRAPHPAETLAATLRRLLEAPRLGRALGDNAAAAMPAFSNENVASRYLQLFASLIEAKQAGTAPKR